MTINKKIILRIFGAIAVIFIILFIFLWFYYKRVETGLENVNINATIDARGEGGFPLVNEAPGISPEIGVPVITEPVTPPSEASVINVATLVAEKMGSYSTDTSNFSNLRDVKYLMSNRMKGWTDDLIRKSSTAPAAEEYYGVTTKALSVDIVNPDELDEGMVDVIVSCQKIETKGKENPVTKIKYQKLKMKLLKVDDKWLVDEATWE